VLRTAKNGSVSITYELVFKKVKNINMRIKPDGTVYVSASRAVSTAFIDSFVLSRANFISAAKERISHRQLQPLTRYFNETEVKEVITNFCKKHYPYYAGFGIDFPQIKFRKMISCWGNCRPTKGVLTFNTNLMYAPKDCIEYVVLHEFTHFLHPNHSTAFYSELKKVCPLWQTYKKALLQIPIRQLNNINNEV